MPWALCEARAYRDERGADRGSTRVMVALITRTVSSLGSNKRVVSLRIEASCSRPLRRLLGRMIRCQLRILENPTEKSHSGSGELETWRYDSRSPELMVTICGPC